jgi:prophage regulatory protein
MILNMRKAMQPENVRKERILRLADVISRTGLSRSTIYLNMSNGEFPAPISLGARSVGWLDSEIDDWIAERIIASRNA